MYPLILFLIIVITMFIKSSPGFWLYFNRSPVLQPISNLSSIVSPADGVVSNITKNKTHTIITITLSLLDNHTQYFPMDGVVIKQEHIPGQFHPVFFFWSSITNQKSKRNERQITTLHTRIGDIQIVQIAGVLAKNIRTFNPTGVFVTKGQQLGHIFLGSLCQLILPTNKIVLTTNVGEHVSAGTTQLAYTI